MNEVISVEVCHIYDTLILLINISVDKFAKTATQLVHTLIKYILLREKTHYNSHIHNSENWYVTRY